MTEVVTDSNAEVAERFLASNMKIPSNIGFV